LVIVRALAFCTKFNDDRDVIKKRLIDMSDIINRKCSLPMLETIALMPESAVLELGKHQCGSRQVRKQGDGVWAIGLDRAKAQVPHWGAADFTVAASSNVISVAQSR
jgi:hypothetical protein